MVTAQQITDTVSKVRGTTGVKRNFSQSFEILISLKDIDQKKNPLNINDVVFLPHDLSTKPKICVFATSDFASRSKKAGADRVIEGDELDKLAGQKRDIRKICSQHTFFLAEVSLMAKIGKIFGQFLGPRGKMPAPLPPNASVESIIDQYRRAVRVRSRSQMAATCKVGDQKMADERITENSLSIIDAIEKKLPSGSKNIKNIKLKLTMSEPVTIKAKV